jgi:ABC-2 type transport system permease protein
MMGLRRRLNEVECVFRIHLARLRVEAGPFILAALIFPTAIYLFAQAIGNTTGQSEQQTRFLAGSITFSISLTSISWLGYLLLENRFTGRLKLFATSPLAPSSYLFGILTFALAQTALGTSALLIVARFFGIDLKLSPLPFIVAIGLGALCLCGLSVVVATRARSFSEGSLLTDALGAGLVFLAPVYYRAEVLPRLMRPIAEWLPTACVERAILCALRGDEAPMADFLALFAMTGVALALGVRSLRWTED